MSSVTSGGKRGAVVLLGLAVLGMTQAGRSQWDGIYSKEQAARGEALYGEHCAACHGPDLGGGESAPALAGGEFGANWNDLTLGDLFERIRISMPQSNPGGVSRAQKADIMAFMLSRGGAPAGAGELPSQTEVLRAIRFVAARPAAEKE